MVRQQIRAMAILDTARARQKGFSCRIPFAEFLRRFVGNNFNLFFFKTNFLFKKFQIQISRI
jgi:hypothetical protein